MRNAVIVGVAVTFFGLGAFVSPNLKAQDAPKSADAWIPVTPKVGDNVLLTPPAGVCEVQAVAREWMKCSDAWWNLATGSGYAVTPGKRK